MIDIRCSRDGIKYELRDELVVQGFEDVEIDKAVDEDADEPCDVWLLAGYQNH